MTCETTYAKCLAHSAKIENKRMREVCGRPSPNPQAQGQRFNLNHQAKRGIEIRAKISSMLQQGAVTSRMVVEAFGISTPSAIHHLERLTIEGAAVGVGSIGIEKYWGLPGVEYAGPQKVPTKDRIANALSDGHRTADEIAEIVGVHASRVRRLLQDMAHDGRVRIVSGDRTGFVWGRV